MAELSDQLLVAAVFAYLGAMLGHLVEYTFGDREPSARTLAGARIGRRREPELVTTTMRGAGSSAPISPASPISPAPPVGPGQPHAGRSPATVAGRIAVWLSVLAVAAHAGALVTRGLAAGRVPWGNMYEFVLALSLVGAIGWLVLVLARPTLRTLGLFVAMAMGLLLGLARVVLYTEAAPLVPALNSYWLKIHVTAAASASGLLLLAFVPSALFLIRAGHDRGKRRFPYSLGRRLPAAESLERLAFRLHAFAFPIWTFAIIGGAIWAEAAWGRYWGWDPKETWSFISWVAYAAYLHARATPSVKRTTATWFAVAAWITMLINLYVINFVAVGLHSYAAV